MKPSDEIENGTLNLFNALLRLYAAKEVVFRTTQLIPLRDMYGKARREVFIAQPELRKSMIPVIEFSNNYPASRQAEVARKLGM